MYAGTEEHKCIRVVAEEKVVTVEGQEVKDKELYSNENMEILREMHEFPIGGHVGTNRTYKRLKHFINWEGMKRDIEYIQKCEKCQRNKMTQHHTRLLLAVTDTPFTVFEKCTTDIVGSGIS
jgi:DNA-directed RNA polymerase subunit M/transcription elongation factor TFIIS